MKAYTPVLFLALLIICLCLLGIIWDQYLTIQIQDQTVQQLQKVKCVGEIES